MPEADQRRDHVGATDVRDVESLDPGRRFRKTENAAQFPEIRLRMNGHRQGVRNPFELLGLERGSSKILQCISQLGRLLEFQRHRRPLHFRLQLGTQFIGLAFEELDSRPHLREVFVAGDVADARCGAVFEVPVEAMLVVGRARGQRPAAAQMELPAHERQRPADASTVGKRAEIQAAIVLAQTGQSESRDPIVEVHLQQQEPFVVPEIDVEPRLEILHQPAFQQQRFRLVLHHVPVEVVDGIDERVELEIPAHPPRRMKILADPFAQIPGLPHVDDRAEAILVQIHPGPVGHLGKLVPDMIRDGHRPAA